MYGIKGYSGAFDPGLLLPANRLQAHCGQDDVRQFADSEAGVGLAHVCLSIIDPPLFGQQPMASDNGSVVLVFNGEIYNSKELRSNLETKGYRFRSNSDTEVLLNFYLHHGEKVLHHLNGIFAFAIWDRRNGSLFIARDALGVKPLYYAETSQGVVFASDIKSLMSLTPFLHELDIPALHRYLSYLWCPGEGTPLKTLRKLPPGEAMMVRDGEIVRRWTWYQLPIFRGVSGNLSEKDALAGTVFHVRQAVHRQLLTDAPMGALLSGGLDSSAVVAFAREHVPGLHCFTIEMTGGQEAGMADDLPYAKRVATHLHIPLDVVRIDAGRMASDLENMVAQVGEPLADPAPLNVLYLCQLAREHGMKVLLSGSGGDDLFTGYRRHLAVQYERYWNWLPQSLQSSAARALNGFDQRIPLVRRLTKVFNEASLYGDERIVNYFRWARETELLKLYSDDFRVQLEQTAASDPMLDFLKPLPSSVSSLERMLALEQRFFLADHNAIYTDKMSMAAGVEVRVPFLDLDLVEFAARVPIEYKQRGRIGKWILKKAMAPYLPHDVIYRPKTGFGAPLRRWMRYELRELLGDILSEGSLKKRGLFEPMAVQRLIAANDNGEMDASYTLLSLLCIEIWCRRFLDTPLV